jgi:hypothetical protein
LIPLYRTQHMEQAANLLVKHYRLVLVRAAYDNYVRIRFRADDLTDARCYFNKVESQHTSWLKNGGALITWKNTNREGPHDAIVFVACPKSLQALSEARVSTKSLGVIYEPTSWRNHEQQLAKRFKDRHPRKHQRAFERLEYMKLFVSGLPEFTQERLYSLLPAPAAQSQSSDAPLLLGGAVPSPGSSY